MQVTGKAILDSSSENTNDIHIDIFIPGYTVAKKAEVIKVELVVLKSDDFQVCSQGRLASYLEKALKRNIEIMSSLDESYQRLRHFKYQLISTDNHWTVKDARSAGLSLCIALLNVLRKLNGKNGVQHIAGTGILRIDGTFEKSHLEEEKRQASSQVIENRFINSQVCKHVFDLATLMENKQ